MSGEDVTRETRAGVSGNARRAAGKIVHLEGAPAADVRVTASARRLRSEIPLGEAVTAADGTYRVEYPPQDNPYDLVVRAALDDRHPTEAVRENPGPEETVDLTLTDGIGSEYTRLLADISPLLDGAKLTELTDDNDRGDFGFLARATGRDATQVAYLALASRHAAATGLPAEAFYGLLRQGFSPDLSALAKTAPAHLVAGLTAAADTGVIDPIEEPEKFAASLRAQEVSAFVTATGAAAGSPVVELFALAVPDTAVRERIYNTYLDHKAGLARFWARLRIDEQTKPHADRLRLVLQLGAMTGNNVALVAGLLDKFDRDELNHPRDLAALDTPAWTELIQDTGGAPGSFHTLLGADDVAGRYGELVASLVAEAYPTAHIAHRLAAADEGAPATRFLVDNPEFDLITTPVNARTVPDEAARAQLSTIQRLTKLTRTFDEVQALRGVGIDSAHVISAMAKEAFVERFADAMSAESAAAIHTRAGYTHAAAVNLIADLRTAGQFSVPWLSGFPDAETLTAQIPNWEELFGSPDYCACPECRSVYSQPAYLVDLLLFLRDLGIHMADAGSDSEGSVADKLRRRRPDIWHIELSCDNTNLQLPYVDLVTELLETVIVSGSTCVGATTRQTSGDPTQLRAQPQHVNPAAYDVLRTAVYPWNLPFDLWGEQTRVALKHCGVPRDQLMAILGPTATPSTAAVVEHLGLSSVAGAIIASEPLNPGRTLAEFYGRPAATDLVKDLANVRCMLDTAKLRYAELVEVLDTRFVNPTGVLTIKATDPGHPACNTNLLEIQGLDVYALDRLHRFVRLQRALGWPTVDLDQLLFTGPNQGRLDAAALRCVVAVQRLANRLNLTVEQVLCFYGTLPTHRYATADRPPLYDRLFADPSVVQLEPGHVSPFELNSPRTELGVIGSLTDPAVTSALLGVLEVTDTELAELVTGRRSVAPNRLLDLANLSALYRTVTLARALNLPIAELLRLIELYGNGGPFPTPAEEYNGGEPDLFSGGLVRHPAVAVLPLPDGGDEPELASGAAMRRPRHPDAAPNRLAPVDALIATTDQFLDAVEEIRARDFTVAEVDAVLTASVPAHDGPLPDDIAVAATLTGLRSALQAIYRQTAAASDEKGELTRKSLALLGWDAPLVSDVVTTLLGAREYAAPLDALPAGVKLPPAMRFEPPVEGGTGPGRLLFTGPMTEKVKTDLLHVPGEAWSRAVTSLYDAPRTFIASRIKAFRLPIYAAPLPVQPTDLKLPPGLVGKIFYDVGEHALRSKAYLSVEERDALKAGSADSHFHEAVCALMVAQEAPPGPDNRFLGPKDVSDLFDPDTSSPASRFSLVLTKLNPYLRRELSEITVKQQLGAAVGLDAASADVLLGAWLRSTTQPLALQDFLTPRFVGSDPAVVITREGFGEQFTSLTTLYRVALVLRRLRISAEQIPWVFGFPASAGWLDLNLLPSRSFPGASLLFGRFVRLLTCARLRDGIPGGARTLRAVFTAAREPGTTLAAVLDELSRQTRWERADLDVLTSADLLDLPRPADFQHERGLSRLLAAVTLLRKLGVSAERAVGWLPAQVTLAAAQAAWQTAKARHQLRDWPSIGGPLQDQLRERRRSALVAYLIANPLRDQERRPYWHDADTMFDYFLLDVEMGACQLTTRIAQAIFSVQLYVQRIQLNLESVYAFDYPYLWRQWDWLKSYRLWEANQKVFLYPENYFEPDLRLGKTPLFDELETELLQKELTADHAETVFQHYLEGLDKVSRLRPCGVYTDVDDPNGPTVHLFAHSITKPREYYYRAWVSKSEWTPWRRVDLDIDSETVIPVVWNRRLYVLWPTFTLASEPGKVTLPDSEHPLPDPDKYWKTQLNWSRYLGGAWEAKKTTKGYLKITQGPYNPEWVDIDYSDVISRIITRFRHLCFRPEFDAASGDLILWCTEDDKVRKDGDRFTWTAGFFRLSPGSADVIIDQIKDRYTDDERSAALPIDLRGYTLTEGHEDVEYITPGEFYSGKLYIGDPTKGYFESDSAVLTLQQTPDGSTAIPTKGDPNYRVDQLFRALIPTQFPQGWDRYAPCFTDSKRSYLIDPHILALTLLHDPRSPVPRLERDRGALAAGRSVTALSAASGNHVAGTQVQGLAIPRPTGEIVVVGSGLGLSPLDAELAASVRFAFHRIYHPHTRSFIIQLNRYGPDGLFNRLLQIHPEYFTGPFSFKNYYQPVECYVAQPFPDEPVEFAFDDASADYNWELFFHAPLLVAQRLSTNQRFAEAQQWFHHIFDPTNRDDSVERTQRFWITKPFFETTSETYQKQRIEEILKALASGDPGTSNTVTYWLKHPFQPDAVARLRTTAYQKAVVMKYLDNLIVWGDQLFRQDTLESINQATQLYILADELLGRRPDEITGRTVPPQSFQQLLNTRPPDEAVTVAENLVAVAPITKAQPSIRPRVNLRWLDYFCLPRNDKLIGYWDIVADRLFKIRHCQNIDGVQRHTALFGAPIDPSLLVRAAAAGVDLSTVLDDIDAPLPHYRFGPMVAKAKELTAEVKAFGTALLSALEKRDAEALALLRSGHESAVLHAARQVRQQQRAEADAAADALVKSKEIALAKQTYYAQKKRTNEREDDFIRLTIEALDTQETARTVNMSASAVATIPDVKYGPPTTMGTTWGSSNIIAGLRGWAEALATGASMKQSRASLDSTLGSYDHRYDDWRFQAEQAKLEAQQFDKQIAAAQIRQLIAAKELENHDLQIANAAEADRFLRGKFSNAELYDWLVGQLSTSYFQAYQLAYDVAKRAERAYLHELGVADSTFINFGYWDSLHKGLLAGERLSADLNRMDAAYLDNNAREFELTKRISLAQLDPVALLRLKEDGKCFVSLPEAIFDVDGPGHYLRRIKNVAITIPCVAGPYSSVNLTARLLRSTVRVDPTAAETTKYARGPADTRFRDYTGPVQTIVTSTGQDDTGLFETNLRDERFLPFEGTGTISEWQLSLPQEFRQFDYESITDVVFHLRYTARDGGENLAKAAMQDLHKALGAWVHAGGGKGLYRTFSARRGFSDQWSRFLTPAANDPAKMEFALNTGRFPYPFRDFAITAAKPELVLVLSRDRAPNTNLPYLRHFAGKLPVTLTTSAGQLQICNLTADSALDGQPHIGFPAISVAVDATDTTVSVSISRLAIEALPEPLRDGDRLNPNAVIDLLLICPYTLTPGTPPPAADSPTPPTRQPRKGTS